MKTSFGIKNSLAKGLVFAFGIIIYFNNCTAFASSSFVPRQKTPRYKASEDVLEDQAHNWIFFCEYAKNETKKKLIEDHWEQYFLGDIYGELTGENASDYHCLFYDSYGGLYPDLDEECLKCFRTENFKNYLDGEEMKDKNLLKYTWYQMLRNSAERTNERSVLPDNPKYADLRSFVFPDDSILEDTNSINKFYELWDTIHVTDNVRIIREKLKNKENVVFFMHGYNVPYSLGVLQGKVMIDSLCANGLKRESTLFIPVFWSSNDMKQIKMDSDADFGTLNEENMKNGNKFRHYTNRTYYAAFALRDLLTKLESDLEGKRIFMIAHSLGAVIPAAIFINPTHKFDGNGKDVVSIDFQQLMAKHVPPKLSVFMFLSAPAMPGENTFNAIKRDVFSNIQVFSTININDEMLSKKKKILKAYRKAPARFNTTTMGLNWKNDADNVEFIFDTTGLAGNFTASNVSDRYDHDMFTYLRQDKYMDLLREMIKAAKLKYPDK